uniref:NADH-ubiquinone oxidoreductase chain 4 n=1 Tax=Athripsodes aterrimus TaxID=699862 RepID=A0A7D6WFN6_9NEOP|nr:NADH dehydrogenase subunit 4 [Athripsodes aterrimus]
MMKIFFFMSGIFFLMKNYWMVQMSFLLLMFLLIFNSMDLFNLVNLGYYFGMDLVSIILIMLSIWIIILMIMASFLFYLNNYNLLLYNLNMIILLLMLILTFSVLDIFMFYLFFESSLIPMLIMIFGWGFQCERVEASLYLLFYTLFVSFPLMGGIFYIYSVKKLMVMYFYNKLSFEMIYLYFMMIFAFLVKLPMVYTHIWLPKAHVEAPVAGSMILAGVMLKLGGYGLIRVLGMFLKVNMKMSSVFVVLSLWGGIYICLLCLHQLDFKKLVAYSSVVHMGIFLAGIMTMSSWGMMGAFFMLVGHGLCSSGLFSLINLNYERLYTRSLMVNSGMLNILPSFSLWWFLLLSSNMSAPFSLNLISEVSIINSLISYSFVCMFMIIFLFFFSSLYNLYLFMVSQHGKIIFLKNNFFNLSLREYLLMFLHWIPLNMLFLKMDFFCIFL